MRHRPWIILGLAILLVSLVAGCGARQEATETMTDSTAFATNPTEEGQADLTPQGQVPEPEPEPPPRPAPRKPAPKPKPTPPPEPAEPVVPTVTVPAGVTVTVTLDTKLSTETAQVGDIWTGVVKNNVVVGEKTAIPAGSAVAGVVTAVKPAQKGDRAYLDLAIRGMTVEGNEYDLKATTEGIEAGSTRARNLGAIAGGAAAGALVGRAVGGSGKGALIGGLIGGAAAGGAVAASKGYQVELKEGTELSFSTSEAVDIKR